MARLSTPLAGSAAALALVLATGTTALAATGDDGSTAEAPTACADGVHDSYQVTNRDEKDDDGNPATYDGWHPAVVTDPDTGSKCSLGHDHGDDPKTSDIYDWTLEHIDGDFTDVPMGYAGMQSMKEAEDGQEVVPHRHEDHYGYTFYVLNDVGQVRADRAGYAKADGSAVKCDYLIGLHQGSHSADALKNNAHEIMYSFKCTDGSQAVVDSLSLFGQPNEYTESCTGDTIETSGSVLPASTKGKRLIPTVDCAKKTQQNYDADARSVATADSWGLYEQWQADQTYTLPDGTHTVEIDPWFGVRNPSRIADGGEKVATASLFGTATRGWPWSTMTEALEQTDPLSPFNGARRDVYVQNSTLNNSGGATTWYTDAYGKNASTTPFTGSVKQYAAAVDNSDLPDLECRVFGFSTNYGAQGTGVVAPN